MCQEVIRRLCNPSESSHVRKVARLLARPLTIGSSGPGLPGGPHDLDVVLLGERPAKFQTNEYTSSTLTLCHSRSFAHEGLDQVAGSLWAHASATPPPTMT
jgi:hypothetical protein